MLNRKGEAKFDAIAKSAAISKELEGTWKGAIDAGGVQRQISLTLANRPDGTSTGHFLSLDEGLEIPISTITQKASGVVLDVNALGGSGRGHARPIRCRDGWHVDPGDRCGAAHAAHEVGAGPHCGA